MQQIPSLFIELQNAQRKLLELFDAPETMWNEGTGYSPMFLWPFASLDRSGQTESGPTPRCPAALAQPEG
jgi:hypothetical protein